jgi:hypothetical protein
MELASPAPRQMAKVERPAGALSQPTAPPSGSESRADQTRNQPSADNENSIMLPPTQKKEPAARDHSPQQQAEALRRERTELASNLEVSKDKREMAAGAVAGNAPKAASPGEPKPAPPPPAQSTVEVTSAAPLVQADNADLSTADSLKANSLAKSVMPGNGYGALGMAAQRSAAPMHWRISSDGHVEHTVGPSTWERVMSAEPVTFHVVASVGQNVWAGGSDGALFHSADAGHDWNRVALAEKGTIKTIHFNNAQQGSLTTEAGAVWTTSDGGATWSKQ